MTRQTILTGIIVEDTIEFTLGELSRACGKPAEWILALVEEGVIEPLARSKPSGISMATACAACALSSGYSPISV